MLTNVWTGIVITKNWNHFPTPLVQTMDIIAMVSNLRAKCLFEGVSKLLKNSTVAHVFATHLPNRLKGQFIDSKLFVNSNCVSLVTMHGIVSDIRKMNKISSE